MREARLTALTAANRFVILGPKRCRMAGVPTIFQFWDRDLPDEAKPLVESWRALNPDFDHRLFDEVTALAFIEQRYGARHAAAFRGCRLATMKSDLFRYCTLLAEGGIYADIDIRCLEPIAALYASAVRGMLLTRIAEKTQRRVFPTGFCLFKRPGDPLLHYALDQALAAMERRDDNRIYYTTGPGIICSLYWQGTPQSRQAFAGLDIMDMGASETFIRFENPAYQGRQPHWSIFEKSNSIFNN
jgi:mannosyltransferase OCH1-like enzyme